MSDSRLILIKDLGIRTLGDKGYRKRFGLYRCSCGKEVEIVMSRVKNEKTKSCGCLSSETTTNRNFSHGMSQHLLYGVWCSTKQRCTNKHFSSYYSYGGRGISIYEEWKNNFISFYNWSIENGYKHGLEIDRINNNGNYEPNNCQWITSDENMEIGKRRKYSNNKSGYVGVSFCNTNKKWIAKIKNKKLGYFETMEDAIESRVLAEIEMFGKQITNLNTVTKGDLEIDGIKH